MRPSREDLPLRAEPTYEPRPQVGEGAPVASLLFSAIDAIRRDFRLFVALAVIGMVAGAVSGFLRARTYTSLAAFLPEARRNNAGLSGLAGQLGLVLPPSEPGASSDFYADLLRTPGLLEAATRSSYPSPDAPGTTVSLPVAFGLDSAGPREIVKTMGLLKKRLDTQISLKTGVVAIRVPARTRELSQAITARLLELVNEFNIVRRQRQATRERQMAEERLGEARKKLDSAEQRALAFQESNRRFRTAPELSAQEQRLQREVNFRQSLVTSMSQAYEQARIEEARDIPVITIVQPPTLPLYADSRHTVVRMIIGMLAGLLLFAAMLLYRGLERPTARA